MYDLGTKYIALFDSDTTNLQYSTNRWALVRDNDSLYGWNYAADSLDDTAHFFATYQSKYFFEGSGRERIHNVTIEGTGVVDSLRLIFYQGYLNADQDVIGTPFDTVVFSPDFTDNQKDQVAVDKICDMFSLRIEDFGSGSYVIRGYKIGWQPWDTGK